MLNTFYLPEASHCWNRCASSRCTKEKIRTHSNYFHKHNKEFQTQIYCSIIEDEFFVRPI